MLNTEDYTTALLEEVLGGDLELLKKLIKFQSKHGNGRPSFRMEMVLAEIESQVNNQQVTAESDGEGGE